MTQQNSINPLYRLSQEVAALLETMAEAKGYSTAVFLEQLVRKAALEARLIDKDHQEAALANLFDEIEVWKLSTSLLPNADFTLQVFERIGASQSVRARYDLAKTPLPGLSAEKRRKYVNQSIGRFCKRLIGWESDEEVPVAKDSLIKSYTRLKPPTPKKGKLSDTGEKLDAATQAAEKLDLVISEVTLVRAGA